MASPQSLQQSPERADFRARLRANLVALQRAQKSGAGVPAYTRWVNRRLARGAAAAAAAGGLGPNAVTLISAATSAVGLVLLVLLPVSLLTGVLVAALLALGYLLDSADGQVARLTGKAGPAGEWLDHVVDAIRSPTIHLAVTVATYLHRGDDALLMVAGLCFAVLTSGQFMSQILAEQLARGTATAPAEGEQINKSWFLLPTDTGTLCWVFVLWGLPSAFVVAYVALLLVNLVHSAVSMRRKQAVLRAIPSNRTSTPTTNVDGPHK